MTEGLKIEKGEKLWQNMEQANARLSNTYVMYDGAPHYLYSLYERDIGDITGKIKPIGDGHSGRAVTVPLSDPKFNNFKEMLGTTFFNYEYGGKLFCHLVRRNPANVMRKGLSANNCRIECLGMGLSTRGVQLIFEMLATVEGLREAYLGMFPMAKDFLEAAKESESVAISQHLAIVFSGTCGYKYLFDSSGDCLGCFHNDSTLALKKTCGYRKEELERLETLQGIDIIVM